MNERLIKEKHPPQAMSSCKRTKKSKLALVVRKVKKLTPKAKPLSAEEYKAIYHGFIRLEQNDTYGVYATRYSAELDEDTKKVALVLARHEIMLRHGEDSLEAIRKAMGLAKYREELIEAIAENISFEEGLERVIEDTNAHGKEKMKLLGIKEANNLTDIGKIYPDLSSAICRMSKACPLFSTST
jgi:hypothetical protein